MRATHQDTSLGLLDEAERRLGPPTPIVLQPGLHHVLEQALVFAAETVALGGAAGPADTADGPTPAPAWALSLQHTLKAWPSARPMPVAPEVRVTRPD